MTDGYSIDKLVAHPGAIEDLRMGMSRLLTVHLMPQNVCNHSCDFCSYRLDGNKNSEIFDAHTHIPWDDMVGLLDDLQAYDVKGIEVTGGGEPLVYPHNTKLWTELNRRGFCTALVTNGTRLSEKLAELVTPNMKWARVSLDAGSRETYTRTRRCPGSHWTKARTAINLLREHAPDDPEFRLGVGFVLSKLNSAEIFDVCHIAKEEGADNIRLSAAFTHQGVDFFGMSEAQLLECAYDAEQAKRNYEDETFTVHNLLSPRLRDLQVHTEQDYPRCPTQQLLCVVEGSGKVYTCCTLTGSSKGIQGNFIAHPQGFRGVWEEAEEFRKNLDPSEYCKLTCLYRDRNIVMNRIIDAEVIHKEFI